MLIQIIQPAAERRLLTELAVIEGFHYNRRGTSQIILGIDARFAFAC